MVAEVLMPALSPTMTEGKIIGWNKKEGDKLEVGDVILEVETDKAVMEVEAQNKGVLGKILIKEENVVEVGKIIALILEKGDNEEAIKNYKISDNNLLNNNNENNNNECGDNNKCGVLEVKKNNNSELHDTTTDTKKNSFSEDKHKIFASPLAKSIAKINNVDISNIQNGSGPNGRIVKADVEKFLSTCNTSDSCCNSSFVNGRNPVEFVDIEPSGMRKTIANRLLESKQQIPHWYLKITANMTNFTIFRDEINKKAKIVDGKPEFKISANDLIVMAIARALKKHPQINVSWNNGKIRQYNNVDISVACSIDGGLITPIVKNADQLGLISLSNEIKKLVKKAKDGKLAPNEYQGGSLSVSNLGMYGVEEFVSIINPPQSCIVAVGAINEKCVLLEDGTIEKQKYCKLVFSADHRVIDGAILAPFSNSVKLFLENPAMMLM